ncbi:hypothetical protein [Nocardioides marmoraquaticus]
MPAELSHAVRRLLLAQDGVVSRRQLLALGVTETTVRSWLEHRLLARHLPGVYLGHTGTPSWQQRAWGAVLYAEPAVLSGPSALRAAYGPGRRDHDDAGPVHVLVGAHRTVHQQPGVRVHRTRRLHDVAQWNLSPPRARTEEALLDVAAAAPDDFAAFATIAAGIGARQTTAHRLRAALAGRRRIARRAFLAAALDDLVAGACSVIERAYLRDVERSHGLPSADRQVVGSSRGRVYRDVLYPQYGVCVELDGRADHTRSHDRDRDLDRDLDAAASGEARTTVRLGWGQTVGRPCRTAVQVGRVLRAHGWAGEPNRCPRCA